MKKRDRFDMLRERAKNIADEAELALGAARAALTAAEVEVAKATEALELSTSSWVDATSTRELSDADDARISLAKRLSRARDRAATAAAEVETKRLALVDKRIGERRFELLIENDRQSGVFKVAKEERLAADAHTARQHARAAR